MEERHKKGKKGRERGEIGAQIKGIEGEDTVTKRGEVNIGEGEESVQEEEEEEDENVNLHKNSGGFFFFQL